MKHIIHCHQPYDLNKGGTVGYLSSLCDGFREFNPSFSTQNGIQCDFVFPEENVTNQLLHSPLDERLFHTQNYAVTTCTKHLLLQRQEWFRQIIPQSERSKIDFPNTASIHIHGAYNFFPIYNALIRAGVASRVVKILTTHNPTKPTIEDMELTCRVVKWRNDDKSMFEYYLNERDKWAFTLADALLFPSQESMEGYFLRWAEFKDIIKNKPIYFALTGTRTKPISIDKQTLRQQLQIPSNAKVLVYIGRFAKIKGFDTLLQSAKELIAKDSNLYFVAVGEDMPKQLNSPQWIQISHTKTPQDYINLSDACLSPGRGNYFDLSMIEILSLGKPLICSYVGGARWLENKTSGVIYSQSQDADSIIKAVERFKSLSTQEVAKMSQDNLALYKKHLTRDNFQKQYCQAVDKIHNDFQINKHTFALSFANLECIIKPDIHNPTPQTPNKKYKKLKKLIRTPHLFFIDFLKKRSKKNERHLANYRR